MVQSKAATVDQFLGEIAPDRIDAIRRLRQLCRELLSDWTERMQWGMPGYGPPGSDAIVSFNNQKGYIALYPGKSALEEHRGTLKEASFGGGCVRFAKPDQIDFEAVTAMLKHVRANGRPSSQG